MQSLTRRVIAVAGSAAICVTSLATLAPAEAGSRPNSNLVEARPLASLRAAADQTTLFRSNNGRVNLDLGVYLVAGDEPIDVRATRLSYHEPITAKVTTTAGVVPLPDGLMTNFQSVPKFVHLRMWNGDGDVVVNRLKGFCPGYNPARIRPDAPDVATYPTGCPRHPFTRGAVYGVNEGWGTPALDEYGVHAELPLGRYTARVRIDAVYRQAFGITTADGTATVQVKVAKAESCPKQLAGGCTVSTVRPTAPTAKRSGSQVPESPAASPPSAAAVVPRVESRPDLRSLPALAVRLNNDKWLRFAATVWNAGPSPLVVDGFRRSGDDVMDAYQYFYDASGAPVGHAPAGTMEWDARDGHTHWHFRDFARYRLLDAGKNGVVRSRKEAFCLADTDAVDYTMPGANWRPDNTDLRTSCGGYSSLSVREVLDAGSGDTYFQYLPGQSFNIADLPNGAYYIASEANPRGVIYEARTDNNVSYRKIVLKGTADHRTVRVPAVGLVTE